MVNEARTDEICRSTRKLFWIGCMLFELKEMATEIYAVPVPVSSCYESDMPRCLAMSLNWCAGRPAADQLAHSFGDACSHVTYRNVVT